MYLFLISYPSPPQNVLCTSLQNWEMRDEEVNEFLHNPLQFDHIMPPANLNCWPPIASHTLTDILGVTVSAHTRQQSKVIQP